jgi:hypothetical protein
MKHLATHRKCIPAKSRLKVRCHSVEISLKARESLFLNLCVNISYTLFFSGSRGSAVGWDTALQGGRSRVRFTMLSLKFFIDIILPAALWPGVDLASNRNEKWNADNLTTFLKSGNLNLLEPSGPVQACSGIALPFTLFSQRCCRLC